MAKMADVAERPSALPELCRSHAGVRLEKLGESGLIGEVETIDDLLDGKTYRRRDIRDNAHVQMPILQNRSLLDM